MTRSPESGRREAAISEALARAEDLRAQMRRALEEAQTALADAEENNRHLHRELDLMTGSSARRLAVRTRQGALRAWRALRHPLWTTGTVVRGLAATSAPATARRAIAHIVRRSFPLRLSSPTRRWSAAADDSMAIRWIGAVNLRHRTREALLCHPPAGVEFRATVPAGSQFVCDCALSPRCGQNVRRLSSSRSRVTIPSGGWRREIITRLDPGSRWTDRRWHTVSIPLPHTSAAAIDATVTLSTRVPAGSDAANAWALFGEPRFEWPRPTSEITRSVATFARRVRTDGVRKSLELLRVTGITSHDAYPRWLTRNTRTPDDLAALAAETAALPVPAAHQHRHARLQHRPAVAARLRRLREAAGLSALGTLPVRRRVVGTGDHRDAAGVRGRSRGSASTTPPSTAGSRSRRTPPWRRRRASSSRCWIMTTSCRRTHWRRWSDT